MNRVFSKVTCILSILLAVNSICNGQSLRINNDTVPAISYYNEAILLYDSALQIIINQYFESLLSQHIDSILKTSNKKYAPNFKSLATYEYGRLLTLTFYSDTSASYSYVQKKTDAVLIKFLRDNTPQNLYDLYVDRISAGEPWDVLTVCNTFYKFGGKNALSPEHYKSLSFFGKLKTKSVSIVCNNVLNCKIYIDNKPSDTTNSIIQFPEGAYLIGLKKEGYKDSFQKLVVTKDDIPFPSTLNFSLQKL